MENNLYYTPTLEDFIEGLEYEWKVTKDYQSFTHSFKSILPDLQNMRVKYLDQSDIESLGWKFEKKHAGLEEICFSIGGPDNYDILYMNYDLDSKYMRICWLGEGDVTRFSGTIKNKSELIKLMQQLNIK